MIPALSWGAAGGGAGADRDAPSRFSPRRGWVGGDGAIGSAAGSVLRDSLRVSLEASRPGEDAGLRRDRPGADLEAAGRGQVQMAGDQRRGGAAVRGAAGRVVRSRILIPLLLTMILRQIDVRDCRLAVAAALPWLGRCPGTDS